MELSVEQLTQIGTLVSSLAAAKYLAQRAIHEAKEAMRRADAAHKRIDEQQSQMGEIVGQLREMKVSLADLPDKIAVGFYEKLIAAKVYRADS